MLPLSSPCRLSAYLLKQKSLPRHERDVKLAPRRSLYLLSCSVECAPFFIYISSLNSATKLRSSLILMQRPISVAREQCGTVGLNSIRITDTPLGVRLEISTQSSYTTSSCSKVCGFSGSLIVLNRSVISLTFVRLDETDSLQRNKQLSTRAVHSSLSVSSATMTLRYYARKMYASSCSAYWFIA